MKLQVMSKFYNIVQDLGQFIVSKKHERDSEIERGNITSLTINFFRVLKMSCVYINLLSAVKRKKCI